MDDWLFPIDGIPPPEEHEDDSEEDILADSVESEI